MKAKFLKFLVPALSAIASLLLFLFIHNTTAYAMILGAYSPFLFYLLYRLYRRHGLKSPTYDLLLAAHTFELFAAVYALSGSIKQSIRYLCRREYPLSEPFRSALLRVRSGSDPAESLLLALGKNPRYKEWLASVTRSSVSDANDIFSAWVSSAEEAIMKVDDLLSFMIVFSTILPVILSIILMVFGVRPPLLYLLIVFQLILFQGVYHWIRGLLSLLY
ncbi:MAG: hypothetical protein QXP73_03940 [Candidatus Methanomethylicaceae archaeon]|nr:hypothetical protein [Candidatus Verstraetearchaeota archaeon]